MLINVNISDMKISKNRDDVLVTCSLGSCIGVSLFDPAQGIGGMLHALLPLSKANPARAKQNPHMFVDSGFESMLEQMVRIGANKKSLVCKVAGGGQFLDPKGVFKTGEKNFTALRKVLWENKILISGQDVGGPIPRTLILNLKTGETLVRIRGKETPL